MAGYPPPYVAPNVHLLVISGLAAQPREVARLKDGILITSEIPLVQSEDAATLLRHFKDIDASNLSWNAQEYSGRNRFRVKIVGRVVYRLRSSTTSR